MLSIAAFYFGGDCEATYAIPNSYSTPLGCVNVSAVSALPLAPAGVVLLVDAHTCTQSEPECLDQEGLWLKRARSAAACAAHGTGCLQV